MNTIEIHKKIRERYSALVKNEAKGCCGETQTIAVSCCGSDEPGAGLEQLGYRREQIARIPEGANLGVGCGNPIDLAEPRKGETVLDLGSGAGIDCFIAAHDVGAEGRAIGIDFTPEMIEKARRNAESAGVSNVEFRLGEIENLPVADASVDVVISNCVINLSIDKPRVFREAYRVLRSGGRLAVSDIVLNRELPEELRESAAAYASCIAGAVMQEEYVQAIRDAGFEDVEVVETVEYGIDPEELKRTMGGGALLAGVVSAKVRAVKR
jgi:ubiquinone/menaquinone biosynthesis C-methylase UbiE